MSVIRCKTCKNLFNTAKQERYCSEECRKEARKKVRKKWEKKNPEYMKNYMQEYREKQPCKFSFIAVQNLKQIKSPLKGYDIIVVKKSVLKPVLSGLFCLEDYIMDELEFNIRLYLILAFFQTDIYKKIYQTYFKKYESLNRGNLKIFFYVR